MDNSEKIWIQNEIIRFTQEHTISNYVDLLEIFSNCLFNLIESNHNTPVTNLPDNDAKLLAQMMLTKTLYIKNNLKPISYLGRNNAIIIDLIDPTIIASLIRNIYETSGVFNLIYRNTTNPNEKELVYNLWVLSGLKYRQRFSYKQFSKEIHDKQAEELKQIEHLQNDIISSDLFISMDQKDQKKISNAIKEKKYLIIITNGHVNHTSFKDLVNIMGVRDEIILNEIYTYFSLYSHPSNVSVFQFGAMYNDERKSFLSLALFNVRLSIFFLSIFIADYLFVFPNMNLIFNKLPIRDQVVINFFNTFTRGYDYSINDTWKLVN